MALEEAIEWKGPGTTGVPPTAFVRHTKRNQSDMAPALKGQPGPYPHPQGVISGASEGEERGGCVTLYGAEEKWEIGGKDAGTTGITPTARQKYP